MHWLRNSRCSKHMTVDKHKFIHLDLKEGFVIYHDNNKGMNLVVGKIGNISSTTIENVLYFDGLKHNLLSISQSCDKEYKFPSTPLIAKL